MFSYAYRKPHSQFVYIRRRARRWLIYIWQTFYLLSKEFSTFCLRFFNDQSLSLRSMFQFLPLTNFVYSLSSPYTSFTLQLTLLIESLYILRQPTNPIYEKFLRAQINVCLILKCVFQEFQSLHFSRRLDVMKYFYLWIWAHKIIRNGFCFLNHKIMQTCVIFVYLEIVRVYIRALDFLSFFCIFIPLI